MGQQYQIPKPAQQAPTGDIQLSVNYERLDQLYAQVRRYIVLLDKDKMEEAHTSAAAILAEVVESWDFKQNGRRVRRTVLTFEGFPDWYVYFMLLQIVEAHYLGVAA
jgi:hypothetical protein